MNSIIIDGMEVRVIVANCCDFDHANIQSLLRVGRMFTPNAFVPDFIKKSGAVNAPFSRHTSVNEPRVVDQCWKPQLRLFGLVGLIMISRDDVVVGYKESTAIGLVPQEPRGTPDPFAVVTFDGKRN